MKPDWQGALARAEAHSPFLARLLVRFPEISDLLASGRGDEALEAAHSLGRGAADVPTALRQERSGVALALAVGDLAGYFTLADVTFELSALADRAADAAIEHAIRSRIGDVPPAGMVMLALGKHGAQELNYSSDIDPILLYDPAILPRKPREEPAEAAQRYARAIVETLSAQTSEGYVFRVDLRLRPASEVSPLAIPIDGAITHYESSALAWERAAFIRARAAAGDIAAGEEFLDVISAFVWRRSLDFGAIDDIRRLTLRIRDAHSGPRVPGPGYEVKRGRGGIREAEFFAQTHQLIHGGRRSELRLRGTRAALDALAAGGVIAADTAHEIGEAYDLLRTAEHRLQMVADRQTHVLPQDEAALTNAAQLAGFDDAAGWITHITAATEAIGRHYDALLDQHGDGSDQAPLPSRLEQFKPDDRKTIAARIESWRSGKVRALRSEAARSAFDAMLPALIDALAKAADPMRALARWESLIVGLPSAINMFRLLEARPGLLDRLLRVLTLAPPLADRLARRPELLDALIDASVLDLPGDVAALATRMKPEVDDAEYEVRLDRVRQAVGDVRFALGVQIVEAAQDPLEVGAALCRVAEAALLACADAAAKDFRTAHGRIPGGELAVLGLGRLGGGMLTPASDLDIVYIFAGDTTAESDGRRPLPATLYFNRLAQRLTGALSVPTAEGALYEVDTRLRPQGNQGPLAVSIESFEQYQKEDAWTWEHMALCRARVLFASPDVRTRIDRAVGEVLARERDPVQLKADILRMRDEMLAHKSPSGPLDAKLSRGGLVDLEFVIHYLQLRHRTGLDPRLGQAISALAAAGLVTPDLAPAHDRLTRILIASRLLAPDGKMPAAPADGVLARTCGYDSPDRLLLALRDACRIVAGEWKTAFGQELETE